MSREALSYLSLLLCAAIILNARCTSGIGDRCLELIRFNVDEIENHLSELNLTDVATVKMMTAGFKCPISTLPFGTLKSDWARLLLLREAQPDGSIIKLKLLQLMRLLIVAYYQMEERMEMTDPGAKATKESLVRETTTSVSVARTSQPHCPAGGNSSGVSSNDAKSHRSRTDSFSNDVTRLATKNDCPRIERNATVIEIATKSPSSPSGTTTDATRQNVTPSIDLPARTYYSGNAKKRPSKIFGNCLKYFMKDDNRARQSRRKLFETVRNKTKYGGRAAVKVSPPTNEFWRHVTRDTFPTRALLTVVAPTYRAQRLGGLEPGPRRSRKLTKMNNDIYESLRRFYGVGKNEEGTK